MFETDRLAEVHVRRCNALDEIWVPTSFHVDTFAASGVLREKLVVVPEPVDIAFFDPARFEPAALPPPRAQSVFGDPGAPPPTAWLLSVFKWEARKGWDVLLSAFLAEFTGADPVGLLLLTSPYHGAADFAEQMRAFAAARGLASPAGGGAGPGRVWVLSEHVSDSELASMYRAARAFVLPSRGEGWGRPHVEAMAMGLPVIATNWSGPTAYLDESNGFPLPILGLEAVGPGPWEGHLWASPSEPALRALMRRAVERPDEAAARGKKARLDMVRRFAPDVVAAGVVEQLRRVEAKLRAAGTIRDRPPPPEAVAPSDLPGPRRRRRRAPDHPLGEL